MTPTARVSEVADLSVLAHLRDRLDDGYHWLLDHKTSAPQFAEGVARYQRVMTEFTVGLSRWALEVGSDDLQELQRVYERRLNKGWRMEESEAVIEQFHQVLREYEVICDALRGADKVSGELAAKLRFVEATRRPEVRRLMGKES